MRKQCVATYSALVIILIRTLNRGSFPVKPNTTTDIPISVATHLSAKSEVTHTKENELIQHLHENLRSRQAHETELLERFNGENCISTSEHFSSHQQYTEIHAEYTDLHHALRNEQVENERESSRLLVQRAQAEKHTW